MRVTPHARLALIAAAVAAVVACQRDEGKSIASGETPRAPERTVIGTNGVIPGIHEAVAFGALKNPYDGNRAAIAEGRRLFLMYNCVGCHGGRAGGGMGPSLRDSAWIYGNSDVDLYATIVEGRPGGMPTWGGKIPEDQIWKLIAYIRTLRTADEPDPPPPSLQPNR